MSEEYFPLTAKYDRDWVMQNSLIENVLYYVESLCEVLKFEKGMRVLDLACGKAVSSIFLTKEFDVQLWASDKEVSPTENYKRIIEMNCDNKVFPIKADARNLHFPKEFFDVIIALEYSYFGTDELYLPYISQFLKPKGLIGIVDWCYTRELSSLADVPEYLRPCYQDVGFHCLHSIDWWKHLWEKTGLVKVLHAEILPHSDFILKEFIRNFKDLESEQKIINALLNDRERLISCFRLVGQRTEKQSYLEYSDADNQKL
ncbi:MAG: methyltransferase domain-containing protein [Candidatus Margulisiibacteriota bacterium]